MDGLRPMEKLVAIERCLRCSAAMEWRHGTWQCPRCRLKLGCCEGEPQHCDAGAPPRLRWLRNARVIRTSNTVNISCRFTMPPALGYGG